MIPLEVLDRQSSQEENYESARSESRSVEPNRTTTAADTDQIELGEFVACAVNPVHTGFTQSDDGEVSYPGAAKAKAAEALGEPGYLPQKGPQFVQCDEDNGLYTEQSCTSPFWSPTTTTEEGGILGIGAACAALSDQTGITISGDGVVTYHGPAKAKVAEALGYEGLKKGPQFGLYNEQPSTSLFWSPTTTTEEGGILGTPRYRSETARHDMGTPPQGELVSPAMQPANRISVRKTTELQCEDTMIKIVGVCIVIAVLVIIVLTVILNLL